MMAFPVVVFVSGAELLDHIKGKEKHTKNRVGKIVNLLFAKLYFYFIESQVKIFAILLVSLYVRYALYSMIVDNDLIIHVRLSCIECQLRTIVLYSKLSIKYRPLWTYVENASIVILFYSK